MMVEIRYVGPRAFLYIGSDSVDGIPVNDIKSITYREKSHGSWVSIKTQNESFYYEEPNQNANDIITWLKSQNLPVEGS